MRSLPSTVMPCPGLTFSRSSISIPKTFITGVTGSRSRIFLPRARECARPVWLRRWPSRQTARGRLSSGRPVAADGAQRQRKRAFWRRSTDLASVLVIKAFSEAIPSGFPRNRSRPVRVLVIEMGRLGAARWHKSASKMPHAQSDIWCDVKIDVVISTSTGPVECTDGADTVARTDLSSRRSVVARA